LNSVVDGRRGGEFEVWVGRKQRGSAAGAVVEAVALRHAESASVARVAHRAAAAARTAEGNVRRRRAEREPGHGVDEARHYHRHTAGHAAQRRPHELADEPRPEESSRARNARRRRERTGEQLQACRNGHAFCLVRFPGGEEGPEPVLANDRLSHEIAAQKKSEEKA
jgi:hypothetical protein